MLAPSSREWDRASTVAVVGGLTGEHPGRAMHRDYARLRWLREDLLEQMEKTLGKKVARETEAVNIVVIVVPEEWISVTESHAFLGR